MTQTNVNVFDMHLIANNAKSRVDEKTSLDARLKILKEELQKEGYDYEIYDLMSGMSDSFSVIYSNTGVWIQLFPGKGIENYSVGVRISTLKSCQEMRIAA
jgi:hypothetical protein